MPYLKEEIEEFMQEIHPHLTSSQSTSVMRSTSGDLNVVAEVLMQLTEWAKSHTHAGKVYKASISHF